ncbi:NAD(P)-binding domain-containing protein [Microbacterium sp. HD4P20]|uniref:NAD(P)-dependent oxidoreductase n=1 Tax=Microbacterium sp. HD4P20 TaxID=2864874 RepID=UPI001C63E612|nr:NAD(P)-binding domain-containing protein [Microbacterium sp. HD4P20]MCP2637638.1 NAD(P)-binding domain-containing protein [Microbacterium sp. HD4P20]
MTNDLDTPTPTVSVLGLGPMGSALAQALLSAGTTTTVWNRTESKARPLEHAGAVIAPDAAAAVAASDLVITCLRDHASTRELLDEVPPEALAGRTVVVFASSTPGEARRTQEWAETRGIDLLIGAIMVPTPVIGTPDALILYSGRQDLLEAARSTLEVLAPRSPFVGTDPGMASVLDTAMLEVFFTGMTAFLHAAAVVTANGLSAADFVPWANSMLDILPDTFRGLAADTDRGEYPGNEDNLAMELSALTHMVETSRDAGVDPGLPTLMRDLAREAVERGHGADGWSRIVEVLRESS